MPEIGTPCGQQETASGRVQAWLWFLGLWGKDHGGLQTVEM